MINEQHDAIQNLIYSRQAIVFNRLKSDKEYIRAEKNLNEKHEKIEEMLKRILNKDDFAAVLDFYEKDALRTGRESDEMYFQGLRDGFKLSVLLGDFSFAKKTI